MFCKVSNLLMIAKPCLRLVLTALFELRNTPGMDFTDKIVGELSKVVEPGKNTTINGIIDLTPVTQVIQNIQTKNFVYSGSLTTPPCSEGVTFIIPNLTFPLSINQFISLKKVIKFNSRYTQNKPGQQNLLRLPNECPLPENQDMKLAIQ